jgi:signal transduction histidine kinase
MVELYGLAPAIRILYSALLIIAVALQTLRLFLLVSHREYKIPRLVLLHEIFMLAHLILATMMLTTTLIQRNIIAGYFHELRFIDVVPVALGVWIMLKHRKRDPFVCSILLLLTLLFWTFTYSQYIFLSTNLYFIFRSAVMLDMEWHRIRESITRLSIKEAVDLYPGGILYANEKGRTLITNPAMNRLLSALDINPAINAVLLWESLMRIQDSSNVSVKVLDEKLLIRIRNAGSWLFSNQTIIVNRKRYMQLLAIDITDEDILTMEMEESNNELEELGRELSAATKNIEQLEKEREILRMKTRVHDILGQRLSILSRLLESDMDAGDIIKKIQPLLTDLTKAITDTTDASPQYLLSSLIHSFALIGTTIHLKGSLPEPQKVAEVFAEVIRECATNAVRHADARNVNAKFQENGEEYTLLVYNDGTPPSDPIVGGGGITGMRSKVRELEGAFEIAHWPQFHIRISVPKNRKGEIYD